MKKVIRMMAVVLMLTVVAVMASGAVYAEETVPTNSEEGIDLSTATPEEIEEIGMGAMLEAGLISDGDIVIEDVTPNQATDASEDAETNSGAGVVGVLALVLACVSVVAIAILYFFCAKAGILSIK